MVGELAAASGTVGGMIGGQVFDLEGEHQEPTTALLENIHRAKTGALLRASLRLGAIYAAADQPRYDALSCYGEHVGLAFQIVDDILDVEASSEDLGKTAGKDAQQHKITFPAVYGLEQSRAMAERECALAHEILAPFGDRAVRLHELSDLIVHRKS
jgi:geranylgeranyl pyrophosphate synthase